MFSFFKRKNHMSIRQIDRNYHVTGQIAPAHVEEIKNAGYGMIICMRPDNEGMGQPPFADIKAEADRLGLAAHYLPVTPGSMPLQHAQTLKSLLKGSALPVLAYCASGNRAGMLYQMSQQAA